MSSTRSSNRSRRIAERLLDIGAVHFRPGDPFQLASGKPSPVYVDCRKIISFPETRTAIVDSLAKLIRESVLATGPIACIAGGETAGIPFAALVADRLDLPMTYIRKKPKGYGRNARIEGAMEAGDKVLLMEDLATDGGSKLSFVQAIRDADAHCAHAAVVLNYGIFPVAIRRLADAGVSLHALCGMRDVVAAAEAQGMLAGKALRAMRDFMEDPADWQARRMAS